MKAFSFILVILLIAPSAFSQSVLERVVDKLNSLKSVSYTVTSTWQYHPDRYFVKTNDQVYLEFTKEEAIGGIKYQSISDKGTAVYCSGKSLYLMNNYKQYRLETVEHKEIVAFSSTILNSFVTLRNFLPKIQTVDSLRSKVVVTEDNKMYLLEITVPHGTLDGLGETMYCDIDNHYFVKIDKKTFLPIGLKCVMSQSFSMDYVFDNIKENAPALDVSLWDMGATIKKTAYTELKQTKILATGDMSPNYELTAFNGKKLTRDNFKDRFVVIDFFMPSDTKSETINEWNSLCDKYKNSKGAQFIFYIRGEKEWVAGFYDKFKVKGTPSFGTNTNWDGIGVGPAHNIIVVDKEGKIVYLGGLSENEIAKAMKL